MSHSFPRPLTALLIVLGSVAHAQSSTVFVGSSTSGSTDRHYFVDAANGTVISGGGSSFTDNVSDALWADYGQTLYVTSSIQNRINRAVWNGATASWSLFYSAPSACYGLGHDRTNHRLWVLVGSGSSELHCIDIDPTSQNYAQRIAETTALSGPIRERWRLAPNARLAAVPHLLLQGGSLDIVDTDPTSSNFLQIVHSAPVPGASAAFCMATDVEFSRDSRWLWLLFSGAGFARLAVLDMSTLSWIDFNPNQAGNQSLQVLSSSGSSLSLSPDGLVGIATSNTTAGNAVRIQIDPAHPTNSVVSDYTGSGLTVPRADGSSMSPTGDRASLASTPGNLVGPSYLVTLNTTTGQVLSNVALANIWNVYTSRWREDCPPPVAFCTAGTTTNGCTATLEASGVPSASSTSGFTLTARGVEGAKQGLIFYSITGRTVLAWGSSSSFLCVKAPTQRTPAQLSGGTLGQCNGSLSLDWSSYVASASSPLGAPFSAGGVVQAQAWFRDPPSPKTTMLSSALEFTLCP
ncbi:MAG: hypothetical protein FJ298_08480 [Planctomycetes bacterium]|nr:hypothetical protein [Planctomycetota bacterium]